MRGSRRWSTVTAGVAALVVTLVASGCDAGEVAPAPDAAPSAAPTTSVLGEDVRFYVDPQGNAVQAVAQLRSAGKRGEARRLQREIADRPSAVWLTNVSDAVYAEARAVTAAAATQDALPVLVAYNLPDRDCGGYSYGGAEDIDAYLDWVGSLAAGIGRVPALVVLEPDAVPHSLDGCVGQEQTDERYRLLSEAVAILKRQPGVRVYIDAGNASWISDLDALAAALRASGVEQADGFALNVSSFDPTARSVKYGDQLSRRLDGTRFLVDTSRNGAVVKARRADPSSTAAWCNPEGARLGTPPTTDTEYPRVDALLWVKQPGDSDGTCGAGAPPAGQWWPRYAGHLMGDERER